MFEELKSKYEFWYAKKFIVLDKHFQFMLDLSDKDTITIRILKKYPGVIVEYTNIHMNAGNSLSYDIDIVANPNLCDVKSKRFNNFTASIFRSIILGSIEYAKESKKEPNENRNTDTLQSDSERDFYEEVITVSEERVPERKPRKKAVRGNKKVHSKV